MSGEKSIKKRIRTIALLLLLVAAAALCACGAEEDKTAAPGENGGQAAEESGLTDPAAETTAAPTSAAPTTAAATTAAPTTASGEDGFTIPEYAGQPSVKINGNVPVLDDELKTGESFEEYGSLDRQGRCTTAIANLSIDTEPKATEERGDISSIHPSGWRSGQGWERCHLIGWQLSAENDNARNLVTGTHYMNVSGMLPYENEVHWYIEETGNHVLYEVTPVFRGKDQVCAGVHMQAESVEDDGRGVSFNVFCFNVSPGHEIDYRTGEVEVTDEEAAAGNSFERTYVLNNNTMRFHYPSCSSVAQMAEHNRESVTASREELIRKGYQPCGNCEP